MFKFGEPPARSDLRFGQRLLNDWLQLVRGQKLKPWTRLAPPLLPWTGTLETWGHAMRVVCAGSPMLFIDMHYVSWGPIFWN